MKKVLSVVIVTVMIASLFATIPLANFQPGYQEDVQSAWEYVTHVSYDEIREGILCGANAANIDTPTVASGTTSVKFWGWLGAKKEISGFSYTVAGGAKTTDPSFKVEAEGPVVNAAAGTGATSASRFGVDVPVKEGSQRVKVFVDYTDGTSEVIWACVLTVGEVTDLLETSEEILTAAYALGNGKYLVSKTTKFTLKGVITEIVTEYSEKFENISVNIVVDGLTDYPIQCYRLQDAEGVEGVKNLAVGHMITVNGAIKRYNATTVEFDAKCELLDYYMPSELEKFSFDWYALSGAILSQAGKADRIVTTYTPTFGKNAEVPGANVVGFLGWALLANEQLVKSFAYSIDGGALQDSPPSKTVGLDRTTELTNAGMPTAEGFWIIFSFNDLAAGKHTATLYTVGQDDAAHEMLTFSFRVVDYVIPVVKATCIDSAENDGSVLTIKGWTGADYAMSELGYSIDGEEAVFDGSVVIKPVAAEDPVKADANGGQYAERFEATIDLYKAGIRSGDHTVSIVAKYADANSTVLTIHKNGPQKNNGAIDFHFDYEYRILDSYYDELHYDGVEILKSSVDKKAIDPANRDKIDYIKGTVSEMTFVGWVKISDDAADIAGFGYSIDGGEVVTGDFIYERREELETAGKAGANGFSIIVPVADLDFGDHLIELYVIDVDGGQIKLFKDRSTAEETVINPIGLTFTVKAEPVKSHISADQVMNEAGQDLAKFGGNNATDTQLGNITGKVTDTMTVWGWFAASKKIEKFGYRYGDEYVIESEKFHGGDDAVIASQAAGLGYEDGESVRFRIAVPLRYGNDIEVYAVAKLEDGSVIDIWKITYTFTDGEVQLEPQLGSNCFDVMVLDGAKHPSPIAWYTNNPIQFELGTDHSIQMKGWSQVNYGTITGYGYRIDDGELITEANFLENRPDLAQNGIVGGEGFDIVLTLTAETKGAHTLNVVVIVNEGDYEFTVYSIPFSVNGPDAPHEHTADGDYQHDANGHWHVCSECGEKFDEGEHVYDDENDMVCNVCGYSRALKGDITGDGKVNNKDVVSLFRYVSAGSEGADMNVYDITGDGKINNKDVVLLFRLVSEA